MNLKDAVTITIIIIIWKKKNADNHTYNQGVDFSLNLNSAVLAAINVHCVSLKRLRNYKILVVLLIFLKPKYKQSKIKVYRPYQSIIP